MARLTSVTTRALDFSFGRDTSGAVFSYEFRLFLVVNNLLLWWFRRRARLWWFRRRARLWDWFLNRRSAVNYIERHLKIAQEKNSLLVLC